MADHQKEIEEFGNNNDFWLFGYGSLIWKPPPHYDQRVPGYIEGYVRRFWQASEDHRGTPEAPGRVVTLIDKAHWDTLTDHHVSTERVWGAAYHIPTQHVAEVRNYLDIREINGYSIQFTPFHPAAPSTTSAIATESATAVPTSNSKTPSSPSPSPPSIRCLVYIGLPSNPQFLGPQDPDALARKILESTGPSGENKEYLYNLEKALEGLSSESEDAHVKDLVARCREIESSGERENVGVGRIVGGGTGIKGGGHGGHELHRVGSTEEVEEVEK
ncbi:ChaC-like protein-domain-containing protein [Paraphoma chrysanthemicola]|nr:ChaC-like protein-domain-containing protein [Paraphoma chrysanthemicola]